VVLERHRQRAVGLAVGANSSTPGRAAIQSVHHVHRGPSAAATRRAKGRSSAVVAVAAFLIATSSRNAMRPVSPRAIV